MLGDLAELCQISPLTEQLSRLPLNVDTSPVVVELGQEKQGQFIAKILLKHGLRVVISHPIVDLSSEAPPMPRRSDL